MVSPRRWVVPLLGLAVLSGCLDTTSAPGDVGRVVYSLHTDYEVPEGDLREARIVTGHPQRLSVDLTARGARDIAQPELLQHRMEPAEGTTVRMIARSGGSPPDVEVTTDLPGTYRLLTTRGAEVMDEIALDFERPAGFDLLVRARGPWEEDFVAVSGDVITLDEGSQVVVQAIPVDGQGRRLAGDLTTEVTVGPAWAVIPGADVYAVTEWGVWSARGEMDFYLIEPGGVAFTVRDPVNDASTTRAFVVTAIAH